MMELSIIIPTLNEVKYLPCLLDSILRQEFRNFSEIVIADADSTDTTVEIAKNYGCKIVPGGLPAIGRNNGAKIAKGDFLLFLDADTILTENSLEQILKEFQERSLDIASFSLRFEQEFYPIRKLKFSNGVYDLFSSIFYNFPSRLSEKFLPQAMNAILVKKYLHQKISGFNEKIKIGEELDYIRRGAKIGKFGFLRKSKIFVSSRRFQKDGLLSTWLKYFLCQAHMLFLGPVKSNIFKYRFGHYQKMKNEV